MNGTASIDISSDAASEVLAIFKLFGIRVIGTAKRDGDILRMVITGVIVPNAALVTAPVTMVVGEKVGTLTMRFEVVEA